MLSGFLFDCADAVAVRAISYVLPADIVALLQTIFLAGDVWSVIIPNATRLAEWRWCYGPDAHHAAEETGVTCLTRYSHSRLP